MPLLLVCTLLAAPACNKRADVPDANTPAPAAKTQGPPVTEQEAQQFGEQLTQALWAGDVAGANRLLHMPELFDRLVSDLDLSARERESFARGARDSGALPRFADNLRKVIADGGSYQLLRVRTAGGQARPLFRMVSPEGAINYHDYLLARFPDGVGMEDCYIYLTAEPLSQTLRRLMLPALARGRQGALAEGKDAEYWRGMAKLGDMSQAFQQRQFAKAAAIYRGLPQKLRDDKGLLIGYMQVLRLQGEAAEKDYLAALERFRTLYPDNAAADFMAIDYHLLKKHCDEALKAVDRLDTAVGGDPYLDAVRATALTEAKRFDQARAAAERAIKAEPASVPGYGVRLLVSLRERRYADTLEWLKKLVQTCGVQMDDLAGNPEYAGFVRSPQYQQWLDWYKARGEKK